jgi:hypothetical protein
MVDAPMVLIRWMKSWTRKIVRMRVGIWVKVRDRKGVRDGRAAGRIESTIVL